MPWGPSASGRAPPCSTGPAGRGNERILAKRANGRTFQAITDGLMADGILTARGLSRWYPATVKAVVESDKQRLDEQMTRTAGGSLLRSWRTKTWASSTTASRWIGRCLVGDRIRIAVASRLVGLVALGRAGRRGVPASGS